MKDYLLCVLILIIFSKSVNASKLNNYNFNIINYKTKLLILKFNLIPNKSKSSFKSMTDSLEFIYYNKYVLKSKIKNKLVSNRNDSLVYYFLNKFDYHKKDQEHKKTYHRFFLVTSRYIIGIFDNIFFKNDSILSNYMKSLCNKNKIKNTINSILKFTQYGYDSNHSINSFISYICSIYLKKIYCIIGNTKKSDEIKVYKTFECNFQEGSEGPTPVKIFGLNFIANGQNKCLYNPPHLQKYYLHGFNKIFNEYRLGVNNKCIFYLDSCLNMFNKIFIKKQRYTSKTKKAELKLAFDDINYTIINYTQSLYNMSHLPAWVKDPKKVEWHSIIKLIYLRAMASCLLGNTEAANADFKIIQDYAPNLPIFKINSCH